MGASGPSPSSYSSHSPSSASLLPIGIIANYAAVAADTFSSELGILSKSKPRLVTSWNLRTVPPGTNGGVTLLGLGAGLLGSSIIAVMSAALMPFCRPGDAIGDESAIQKLERVRARLWGGAGATGLQGGVNWGWTEIAIFVLAVTIWGAMGSLLDSFLGGWLQASVTDVRTGKVIEGSGGKKVPVVGIKSLGAGGNSSAKGQADGDKKDDDAGRKGSRNVESGRNLLDNNGVNWVMAVLMSVGGMSIAGWIWKIPLSSIFA